MIVFYVYIQNKKVMKLKDIKQKCKESFEVQVKPKRFSYKDLYE